MWRRTDQVSPELAAAVFARDREVVEDMLSGFGYWSQWARDRVLYSPVSSLAPHAVICPAVVINLDELGNCKGRWRIEHVKKQPRFGRRAEPEMARLMALCEGHTEAGMKAGAVWATAHREEQRRYLEQVNKES